MRAASLLTLLLVLAAIPSYNGDFYWIKIAFGAFCLSLLLALYVWQRIHPLLAASFVWTMGSLVWTGLSPLPHLKLPEELVNANALSAASGTVVCLLVVTPLLVGGTKFLRQMKFAIAALCIINAAYVVLQACLGATAFHRGGLFDNASLNASMIAVMYPVLLAERSLLHKHFLVLIKVLLPIVAVLCTDSTVGIVAMIFSLTVYLLTSFRLSVKQLIPIGLVLPIIVILNFEKIGITEFFNSSGRVYVWKLVGGYFLKFVNPIVGMGQGAAFYTVPALQKSVYHQTNDSFFAWLHNEWLQVLVEQGAVGFALAVTAFSACIYYAWKSKASWLFTSLATLGLVACVNYPARALVPAFISFALIVMGFESRKDSFHGIMRT